MVTVAQEMQPLIKALFGSASPVRIQFWDGSSVDAGSPQHSALALTVNSVDALKRIVWAPGELGLARAFVEGDIDADGDVVELITALSRSDTTRTTMVRSVPAMTGAIRRLGLLGLPPSAPDIEYQPPLWNPHSTQGDAAAISHHYDVSNEFYSYVLGESMTYSCARFASPDFTLAQAQAAKHDNICRKLGLDQLDEPRLLDVGCGWGSMAIHAAATYGAQVVGITISEQQARLARKRVADAGVGDLVEIRLQDYRDLGSETFDAISSVGMSEHVGKGNLTEYFTLLKSSLQPQGRLLNHAISSIGGSKLSTRSFMYRYIFPGGELIDIGDSLHAMQAAGFEIRDVESLREHYAQTLKCWIANLESNWDAAVDDIGLKRARAWRLYMAASAVGFTDAGLNVHQSLGVVNAAGGASGMPSSRPV